jgi:hypothetical protein
VATGSGQCAASDEAAEQKKTEAEKQAKAHHRMAASLEVLGGCATKVLSYQLGAKK